ncbi:MAG TPA: hypothetical protein VD927_13440 [Chryseosolibacter sp.]|nr:hypothetical protein [Chryseosolibacter sp.]
MKTYYGVKLSNAIMVVIVFLATAFYSLVHGQTFERISQAGYEISYGLHQLSFKDADPRIGNLTPGSRGVSVGIVYGNRVVKSRIRPLGIYHSDEYNGVNAFTRLTSEIFLNFYPLEFVRTHANVLDVYLFSGLNFGALVFENKDRNKTHFRFSHTFGAGIEYLLPGENRFVHLFTEASLGKSLYNSMAITSEGSYKGAYDVLACVNFGVRFGRKR